MLLGSNILYFENLPSTNTHALTMLKTGDVSEGTVVRAAFQSSGRGQAGNKWESEKGKNLLFSIILKPTFIQPADQFLVSMSVSLGITDFLDKYITDVKIKWPNDIYVKSDKIAGILIENSIIDNSITSSVVGIGLNINQKIFPEKSFNAVSLTAVTGREHDCDKSLSELLEAVEKRYFSLRNREADMIRSNYLSRLYRLNDWSLFTDAKGEFHGRITDVKNEGFIVIEDNTGILRNYSFKEVEFSGLHHPSP